MNKNLRDLIKSFGNMATVILWTIWCSRNKCIFYGVKHSVHEIYAQALSSWSHIVKAYGSSSEVHNQGNIRYVSWMCPTAGTVALNVTGSAFTNIGLVGFGGIIRYHTGSFLHGYYGSVGISCIMHAELLAIHHGLLL